MNNLGSELLNEGKFPANNEENLNLLLSEVKKGRLGIDLSSFEEIYDMTPKSQPFPIGCVNFNDKNNCFVFSWRENFSGIGLKNIEEYLIKIRVYPVDQYPVISIIIGFNSGKIDPSTGEDIWFYGESLLDPSYLLTRIKLYQLLNCNEILFCLYDGNSENLDTHGFSIDRKELKSLEEEINAAISLLGGSVSDNHVKMFGSRAGKIQECFNTQGLPKSQEALKIYQDRKAIDPKPNRHNWNEFLSI